MNSRLIVLTCAFVAAACNSADNKPAQDPVVTTSGQASGQPATSPAVTPADPTLPSANMGTNSQYGTSTTGQNGTPSSQYGTTPTSQYGTPSNAQDTTSPPPATPNVADNPGVADGTPNADNTKINDRDRHGTLTPTDQGNSGAETKITANIRKGLMSDKTLSFTAKNVKVITVGSKVTLRGPVKSDQEKATIESVARQTAGVNDVDNQLEVKK
jgi:hyperosmotically inducible periplasmic protein